MTEVDAQMRELARRISALETSDAVRSEQHGQVIRRLDNIDGHLSKVIWILITAIIGGFITFALKGGLVSV